MAEPPLQDCAHGRNDAVRRPVNAAR